MVEDCHDILKEYGFRFIRRGPIFVKGKGELLTFFMKGKDKPSNKGGPVTTVLPHQVGELSWPGEKPLKHSQSLSYTQVICIALCHMLCSDVKHMDVDQHNTIVLRFKNRNPFCIIVHNSEIHLMFSCITDLINLHLIHRVLWELPARNRHITLPWAQVL